ncbi:MAG: flavin reductase [Elusimicrobia bacterium RIFOXYD2_FULL_34_15]|nr:MAG: flavin reductase [Elusimicrobia bacterium RIFOXYD2_FULL_34_15]
MENTFAEIEPNKLKDNVFKLIGIDYMLITAGTPTSFNTMTAGWGGFGFLWGKNVCFCFIRPNRYTYNFVEKSNYFTLSFFDNKYKDVLNFCGSKSGRDTDKVKETGLSPVKGTAGIYFAEARLVFLCKKIYYQDINPKGFINKKIDKNYPNKDYHRMYTGEIIKCLVK